MGHIFKTSGYTVSSQGYMAVYQDEIDNSFNDGEEIKAIAMPKVKKGELLTTRSVNANQHFTEPPPRYTEASLIKFLEENGIGRPSTYAPIISILTARKYVKREGKSLVATPLGEFTVAYMKENFPSIIDYEFTAGMENKLDSIENNENTVEGVLNSFWVDFKEELNRAQGASVDKFKSPALYEQSDYICEKCGQKMVFKEGRYGKFLACQSYPQCKFTITLDKDGKPANQAVKEPEKAGFVCERCGSDMVVRTGRYGVFYACSNYPTCKNTKQKVDDIGVPCPKCHDKVVAKHAKGRTFYACTNYPKCDFSSWDMPTNEPCPYCSSILFYRKSKKIIICKNTDCTYKREEEMTVVE